MKIIFCVFIIGITPAYLNEEAQENDPSESPNHNCPHNKMLLQALNTLNENLVQDENKLLSPEKLKKILETLIVYFNNSQAGDVDKNKHAEALKDIIEQAHIRYKKDVLRTSLQAGSYPGEKLSGKITLQYDFPPVNNGDCQTLFKAIVNAMNAAYLQMSMFCAHSGKCEVRHENILPSQNLQFTVPSYQISHKENIQLPALNQQLDKSKLIDLLGYYPQYADIMTVLQNYRPNPVAGNTFSNPQQAANNVINPNGMSNDLTNDNNKSLLEVYNVYNRPSGYYVSQDSTQPLATPRVNVPYENFTYNNPLEGSPIQKDLTPVESLQLIKNTINLPGKIPADFNNLRLNMNLPDFPINKYPVNNNIPPYQYQNAAPNTINGNVGYKIVPNYQNYGVHFVQQPEANIQTGKMFASAPSQLGNQNIPKQKVSLPYNQKVYYPGSYFNQGSKLPSHLPQQIPPEQQFYNLYQTQNPHYLTRPQQTNQAFNHLGTQQLPSNQRNVLINQQIQGAQNIPDPSIIDLYKNFNNTVDLHDLYRLTTMPNGPKLNIAPNKNGVVELTFTLQRPQTLENKPLYYVKYRLPYQTYKYNIQNLLQRRPFLRNNPARLYQELLSVANMTESSQDLKNLHKEEIAKLIATNGALIKAKVVNDGSNSVDSVIAEEVQSILKLSAKLGAEEMLNATKMAINNIAEFLPNDNNNATRTNESAAYNVPENNDVIKSGSLKALGNPLYVNPPFLKSINGIPYMPTDPSQNGFNSYNTNNYYGSKPTMNRQAIPSHLP